MADPVCALEPGGEVHYAGVQWLATARVLFGTCAEVRALVAASVLVPVWRLGEPVGRA